MGLVEQAKTISELMAEGLLPRTFRKRIYLAIKKAFE